MTIVADRECHSIHLARWIEENWQLSFILRIKAGTWVEIGGRWQRAGELARPGSLMSYAEVKVRQDPKATHRVRLVTLWKAEEKEPWLLLTNLADDLVVGARYGERCWLEEMFSDHKKRGFQLEASRITDPQHLQRLLVAVTLAYLWVMEVGALVVRTDGWRQNESRLVTAALYRLLQAAGGHLKKRPPVKSPAFRPAVAA